MRNRNWKRWAALAALVCVVADRHHVEGPTTFDICASEWHATWADDITQEKSEGALAFGAKRLVDNATVYDERPLSISRGYGHRPAGKSVIKVGLEE